MSSEGLTAESEKLLRDFDSGDVDYSELAARLWMIERTVRYAAQPAAGEGLEAVPVHVHDYGAARIPCSRSDCGAQPDTAGPPVVEESELDGHPELLAFPDTAGEPGEPT